jgi:hypothetical protein
MLVALRRFSSSFRRQIRSVDPDPILVALGKEILFVSAEVPRFFRISNKRERHHAAHRAYRAKLLKTPTAAHQPPIPSNEDGLMYPCKTTCCCAPVNQPAVPCTTAQTYQAATPL